MFIRHLSGTYLKHSFATLEEDKIFISLSDTNKQICFLSSCLSNFMECITSFYFSKWGAISQVWNIKSI